MQGPDYRKALKTLQLTQVGAAKLLGVNDRTSRRWIADEVPIPQSVEIALRLMIKHKIKPQTIYSMLGLDKDGKRKEGKPARRSPASPPF